MAKEVTIKLPDGTVIQIPSGDTESLKTALAFATGRTLDNLSESTTQPEQKITSMRDLISASKIERISSMIRNHYPKTDWFTSNEVCELYEIVFKEGIKMSTVSTYLARLADEDLLNRKGNISQRLYSVTDDIIELYASLKIFEIPSELLG